MKALPVGCRPGRRREVFDPGYGQVSEAGQDSGEIVAYGDL